MKNQGKMDTQNFSNISRRIAAMFYDSILLFAILMACAVPFVILLDNTLISNTFYLFLFQASMMLVWESYFVYCWRRGGQTLGMKAWKIKLVDGDNRPLGFLQCLKRWIFAWSLLLIFPILLAAYKKTTWYDKATNSYICRT